MEVFEDGRPARRRARVLYAIARFQEDLIPVFFEWFLLTFGAVVFLQGIGLARFADVAVLAVMLVIILQVLLGARVSSTHGYAVDLAYRASGGRKGKGPSILTWQDHTKAMKRIGQDLSGGRLYDLLLMALPEPLWDSNERPASFREMMRAVETGLIEDAGRFPAGKRGEPFRQYAKALEESANSFTFERWRAFLVARYSSLSPRCRAVARQHTPRPPLERVEALFDKYKWTITVVLAIFTLIVTAAALLR